MWTFDGELRASQSFLILVISATLGRKGVKLHTIDVLHAEEEHFNVHNYARYYISLPNQNPFLPFFSISLRNIQEERRLLKLEIKKFIPFTAL